MVNTDEGGRKHTLPGYKETKGSISMAKADEGG